LWPLDWYRNATVTSRILRAIVLILQAAYAFRRLREEYALSATGIGESETTLLTRSVHLLRD
jgi:hypothetical protein